MKAKVCTKCGKEKSISEFYKNKNSKDEHDWCCIKCLKIQHKLYYQNNRKKMIAKSLLWHQNNPDKAKKAQLKYQKNNKENLIKHSNNYRKKHPERVRKNWRKYYKNNKEKLYNVIKKKRKTNIKFKLKGVLRTRIAQALKNDYKSLSTMFLLGCEIDYLIYYLQCQFKEGMTWDNHGSGRNGKNMQEWHIDHIKPCSQFDLSKPEEQRKCFHYSNLQPLWAIENLIKGEKL